MPFLTLLAPLLMKVIGGLFPDPVQAADAKLQIQQALNQAAAQVLDAQAKQLESQASVVRTEIGVGANGWQKNWRPALMYLFMIIIGNNFILFPIVHAFFPEFVMMGVPEHMWTLIDICVGGYVGGRSLEKIATTAFDNKKFVAALQTKMGKLSEKQLAAVNSALDEAEVK